MLILFLSKSQCPVTRIGHFKMKKMPICKCDWLLDVCYDLAYAMSLLSRYMSNPRYELWLALKHVVNYIRSTLDVGLLYRNWVDDGN